MMPNNRISVSNSPRPFLESRLTARVGTAGFEPATTRPPAECATRLRHVPTYRLPQDNIRRAACYHRADVARAASYIRTDTEGELPPREEQQSTIESYATEHGHELIAAYEDLDAPGVLLYHRSGIKEAINNIKEEEDWEVLIVAHPRAISDTESARHELVHKFSLYNNRLECPLKSWDEFLEEMKAYRREMSKK